MNPRMGKKMILLHAYLFGGILLFPLYDFLTKQFKGIFSGCLLHDLFEIYCPLCGGTRAVGAMLRLDFEAALCYNALVVLFMMVAIVFYGMAWIRFLRKKDTLFVVPKWIFGVGITLLVLFGIMRNVLMIGYGIDPLGDLYWFWNQI